MYRRQWKNYDNFREAFLHRYWSAAEQFKLRNKISTVKWNQKMRTMLNHLAYYVSQSNLLTEAIPENILVSELIRHYPREIQAQWQASERHTITELAEFIRKQESLLEMNENRKTYQQVLPKSNQNSNRPEPFHLENPTYEDPSEKRQVPRQWETRNQYRYVAKQRNKS